MDIFKQEMPIQKELIHESLFNNHLSSFEKYQRFFVGLPGVVAFLKFELITILFGPMPGALGLLLRKRFYPYLFKKVGSDVVISENITVRHPDKIEIGDRVAIDSYCLLDAKGAGDEGIQIGNDVVIARGSIIQGKCSSVKIGDRCVIGTHCQLWSIGGISLGKSVMLAGQCYIGGGRYRTENREIPIADQGLYTKGPVIIEDDVWVGAGAIVMDGVRIRKGSVIGSGAVVREDVPEYTVATPYQKLVMIPRGQP